MSLPCGNSQLNNLLKRRSFKNKLQRASRMWFVLENLVRILHRRSSFSLYELKFRIPIKQPLALARSCLCQ